MYIGGEWADPASGEWFESYDPYTGRLSEAMFDAVFEAVRDTPAATPSQRHLTT